MLVLAGCGSAAPAVGWAPPVSANSVVYISSSGGKVYALDTSSGQRKWVYPSDNNQHIAASGSSLYAAPIVGGDNIIAAGSDHKLYVLKASTGEKVCEFQTGDAIIATPGYANGTAYVGSTDIVPNLLTNFDPAKIPELFKTAPSKLYAVDTNAPLNGQCKELWEFTTKDKIWAQPLVDNGRVYVASLDHFLYALDAATGKLVWDKPFDAGGAIASSPKIANGILYFGSFDTNVYAVNAADGKQVWKFPTGNWVWADPLLVKNLIVVGSLDGNVYAIDAKTGLLAWTKPFTTGAGVRAAAAGNEQFVYVGSEDSKVYALNLSDGSKVWEYNAEARVLAAPALVNGMVIVQNSSHSVDALDAASGQRKWRCTTDAEPWKCVP